MLIKNVLNCDHMQLTVEVVVKIFVKNVLTFVDIYQMSQIMITVIG